MNSCYSAADAPAPLMDRSRASPFAQATLVKRIIGTQYLGAELNQFF